MFKKQFPISLPDYITGTMKSKFPSAILSALLVVCCLSGVQDNAAPVSRPTGPWGDQGDGTYKNPILMADYSDPDICRVGNDFYMVCSEFHFMGMPVLHSTDLVNWRIVGRIYDRIKTDPKYDSFNRYAGGSWAPAIRYHDGLFYVYFCTPDEGLYMSTAKKAEGPWSPLFLVKSVARWEDPCPFWDDDGQAYLGHSLWGAGPIIIHKMSADGKTLLDDGKTVYKGPVAEGTKFLKRNGYYYLLIPEGGVSSGNQVALRSKDIYGPYEKKVVLEKGSTSVRGPHQGGLVELENGESWFIHFVCQDAWGRIAYLEPVKWEADWPLMGNLKNGRCEPVPSFQKPKVESALRPSLPQASDDFNSPELGLQWAWNHNPVDDHWSLTERKGWFRIKSSESKDFWNAPNTLTQKMMGDSNHATVKLDFSQMADGQVAGLGHMSNVFCWIGVEKNNGEFKLKVNSNGKVQGEVPLKPAPQVWLKTTISSKAEARFMYSMDGLTYQPLGDASRVTYANWKGSRPCLFSYHAGNAGGNADFDDFNYVVFPAEQ